MSTCTQITLQCLGRLKDIMRTYKRVYRSANCRIIRIIWAVSSSIVNVTCLQEIVRKINQQLKEHSTKSSESSDNLAVYTCCHVLCIINSMFISNVEVLILSWLILV